MMTKISATIFLPIWRQTIIWTSVYGLTLWPSRINVKAKPKNFQSPRWNLKMPLTDILSRFQCVNNGMLSTGRTWKKKQSDHIIPLWISDYKEPGRTIRVVINHQKRWTHIMDHDSAWKTAREWYKKTFFVQWGRKIIDISQTTFFYMHVHCVYWKCLRFVCVFMIAIHDK